MVTTYLKQIIVDHLRNGGYISLSSTGNRVYDSTGKHVQTLTDTQRRKLVEMFELKKMENPIRWIWPK